MADLPANPLQALISKAAQSMPAETGETSRHKRRLDAAGDAVVLICDTSGSMAERAGSRTKYEHLQEAADQLLAQMPSAVVIAFSSSASVTAGRLPLPSGGTALDLALEEAVRHAPRKTVVVSDGEPNDEGRALRAAAALPGVIDVIYCGRDDNAKAMDFMRRLAREGAGQFVAHDLVKLRRPELAAHVQRLALPEAK